jgi:hypothetical protein
VQERIEHEKEPEAAIVVPEELTAPHPLVRRAQKLLSRAKPDTDGLVSCRAEQCLDITVSPAMLDRALRIMDTLLKACASRGLRVEVTEVRRDYYSRSYEVPTRPTRRASSSRTNG